MSETHSVTLPSAAVPGAPRFTVSAPTTWTPRAAPGVIATFDVEGRPGWSVVVSTVRVGDDTSLRDVAVRTFARQRGQFPDAVIRTQRTGRFGDRLTYLREVSLRDGASGTSISQLQILFLLGVSGTGLSDVVSVVASCPDGALDELGPQVIGLVASFATADS